MLDRTTPPPIRQLSEFSITRPDRRTMKNGMPLNIIHAGTEDVVRFDLLIGGGQWNQEPDPLLPHNDSGSSSPCEVFPTARAHQNSLMLRELGI